MPALSAQQCLMSKNIFLKLQYDGTNYNGWQTQNNAVAIQDVVENALSSLLNSDIELIGCSRTDAGVHALGYCCSFKAETPIPPENIFLALNSLLPDDIRAVYSCEKPENFHARYSVKSKTYIYKFYSSLIENPLLRNSEWNVRSELDLGKMQDACRGLIGTHDFTSFMAMGSYPSTTVRTIFDAGVRETAPGHYELFVTGDGFLYNMVRIIAGTIAACGLGKIDSASVPEIIESKDRKKAGATAPAHGLYLFEVNY